MPIQAQDSCVILGKIKKNYVPVSDFATRLPFYDYAHFYGQF